MPPREVTELRPAAGQTPPADLDAEACVLSAVILDPRQIDVVGGILRPEHFYSEANRTIMRAVLALHEADTAVDERTVAGYLNDRRELDKVGGFPYLARVITETPAVAHVSDHAQRVRDKAKVREVIAACRRFAAEGFGDYGNADEFASLAEAALAEISTEGRAQRLRHIGLIMRDHASKLQADRDRGLHVLGQPTGFRKLDEQTAGLFGGDLVVVAGRPGMGKTSFLTSLANNIATPTGDELGTGVAFFSLEMPEFQIASRHACAKYSIDFQSVRTNRMSDDQFVAYLEAADAMRAHPVWIDDTSGISLPELRARTIKLQRDIDTGRAGVPCKKLGLVIVDYLQLMQGVRERNGSREQEVSSLSRGLKKLAKDLDVTVIAASQLNRAPEKSGRAGKRPQLSDLRESGAIEQDADSVWFVHRRSYYDEEAPKGEADIDVAKQRNGPTGRVLVGFRGSTMAFTEYGGEEIDEFDEFDDVPYLG